MPGLIAPKASSLDRLKVLDGLPSLDVQLSEAQRLCTHGARAEMIAKWLFGKLQTSPEARQTVVAWDVLLATLRILPPERVATILGGSKALQALQTALDESEPNGDLLQSVTRLLHFLLEQSIAPAGVAIRAGLSLPSTEAAQFAGVWLRSSLAVSRSEHKAMGETVSQTFEAALQVWNLRKRSSDEHEAFSEHCLGPCAELLTASRPEELAASGGKRLYSATNARFSVRATVESLLARHVFLPGRAAFFRARGTSNTKKVGSQRPSFAIESLLEPLSTVATGSEDLVPSSIASLPQLLEIALRSAPTPSPTQRSHEKPWIETLFLSLHDLNQARGGQLVDAEALCGMLAVLAQRTCTVSAAVLTDIVRRHAGLGKANIEGMNWDLVAAVADADATLFKDVEMARTLFDAITLASIRLGEDADVVKQSTLSKRSTWRNRIVVPVLKVFARYNDFNTALELCSEQLKKDLHGTFWSVWNELDEPIQNLLEESLTADQVHAACLNYCHTITNSNAHRTVGDIEGLNAAIVMLNAVLGGVRSEDTLDRLQSDLEATFEALMELHDAHVGPGLVRLLRESRCWSLMTSIFELWFPRWATRETDAAGVVEKVESLLPRSILVCAIDLSSTVHPEEYGSVEDPKFASDARCFAACVCTRMLAYDGLVSADSLGRYIEVLNALGRQCMLDNAVKRLSSNALVLYPKALGFMDAPIRQALFQYYVAGARLGHSASGASDLDVLKAIGSVTSSSVPSPQVVDDLVTASLVCLDRVSGKSEEESSEDGRVFARILSTIPAKVLTRPQREKVLDRIWTRGTDVQPVPTQILRPCLPLMLRLLELPNPMARICLEPALLSEMAQGLDESSEAKSKVNSSVTAYFEALVFLILQQCIRTQDQERSKKMLVGLSTEVKNVIEAKGAVEEVRPATQYALLKAVFRDLEAGAVGDLKSQLQHRKPSTVKKLVTSIAKVIEIGLQEPNEEVLWSLEVLEAVPSALLSTSGFDLAPMLASLATLMERRLDATKGDELQPEFSVLMVMVHCYRILGKFAATPNVRLALFANGLLQLSLEPRQRAAVVATFEGMLVNLGPSRAALVSKLLSSKSSISASRLLLLQLAIKMVEKTDFESNEESPPTAMLHQLLGIVSASKDSMLTRRAFACIVDVLKTKNFMVNQYNIEVTLQVLQQLAQRGGAAKTILYLDICNTLSVLLLQHRSRLQGRFHMLVKLLQVILTRLFQPLQGWDKETARRPPTAKHAQAFSRLLKLFCEPPQLRKPQQIPSLVDESRKEQAHVGTFVQHVLHHYCAQILHGTLGEGMKDALTPGLRAMIEAMEMGGAEGGKALSAAMNNSERAVLRDLYEEWRRFGKWKGG